MTSIPRHVFDESQLSLSDSIAIVGRSGSVFTNEQAVLDSLRSACPGAPQAGSDFSLQVFVHEKPSGGDDAPYFRGLHHLVFAQFGPSNLFVFDIARRQIRAAVTRSLANDRSFWKERLLPICIGVLGASIGVLPLHAACLVIDGAGILIAGASGAGKSTLSLALARIGAEFISDDWTYIACGSQLRAHGLSAPIKLLPNSAIFFPELHQHELRISLNGELVYELPPANSLELSVKEECIPTCMVFYERVSNGKPELIRIPGTQTRDYLNSSIEPLPQQLSWMANERDRIASRIADLPCWRLRHSGSPQAAAHVLRAFFAPQSAKVYA